MGLDVMPIKESMKKLALFVMVAIVVGCVASTPYEQKIEGIILRDGVGVENVRVRFLSTSPKGTCEASGLEAATDRYGRFTFSQKYTPSKTENYAVVIHPYKLCIFVDGQWQTAWSLTTGPAPHSVVFQCFLDKRNKKVEKCLVSWDRRQLK